MGCAVTLDWSRYFAVKSAVLASMHGKEAAIAPVLRDGLQLDVEVAAGLDTDQFGSFSREVPRAGSPREAARVKIAAALARSPGRTIGIASEGSFAPHPEIPIAPLGRELVLLVDTTSGLELYGEDHTLDTNYAHKTVRDPQEAVAFACACGFPEHGVIISACVDGVPDPRRGIAKQILSADDLARAAQSYIDRHGAVFVEADMRAHRNPTRMRSIGRATMRLVDQFRSSCPDCGAPGFRMTGVVRGLPCSECKLPTNQVASRIFSCWSCRCEVERATDGLSASANPAFCQNCNP